MSNNQNNSIPTTSGQRKIMETVKDELFPEIEKLKEIIVDIQACRISCQLYSPTLYTLENEYSEVSKRFFAAVKKLETPDLLFENTEGDERNILDYFQFRAAFKQNIAEGIGYVEIIDRTLDRKSGAIQNNRTFVISVLALVFSIYFSK